MKKILAISIFCALCMAGTAKDKDFQVSNFNKKELSFQKHNTPFEIKNNSLFASTNEGERPFIKRAMFNMYIDWNLFLGSTNILKEPYGFLTWGGGMNFTFGARIYDYVFVGGGFGLDVLSIDGIDLDGLLFNLPIFFNARAYLPATSSIYPYLDIAAGPSFLLNLDAAFEITAKLRVGIGVDFSRFSLGLGYEGIMDKILGIHTAYLKFGIRIGAME